MTGYDLVTGWGSPKPALIGTLAGTTQTAGFSLSASPSSVTVLQGNSGSSTITSTVSGGFNSAVTLSASGQPAGVTVGFTPIDGGGWRAVLNGIELTFVLDRFFHAIVFIHSNRFDPGHFAPCLE